MLEGSGLSFGMCTRRFGRLSVFELLSNSDEGDDIGGGGGGMLLWSLFDIGWT